MIAEILLNSEAKNLNKVFDYIVPTSLEKDITVGTRVLVPFGSRKQLEDGFVLNLKKDSEFANKEIAKLDGNILEKEQVEFAKLMARRYFCNISECIKLMLPPGNLTKQTDKRVTAKTGNFVYLKKEAEEIEYDIQIGNIKNIKQIRVLNFLKENDGIYLPDLMELTESTRDNIKKLEEKEYIEIVKGKIERNPFINKQIKKDKPLKLTEEQQSSYNKIKETLDNKTFEEFLIYGITGSRKNRSIFAINRRGFAKTKNSNNVSSRNFTHPPNGR